MINGEPNAGNNEDKVGRVVTKMSVTKMTDDKVRKMIARIEGLGNTMTSNQLQTVIAKETSSKSSDSEGEQKVNRVNRDQVWPGTSVTARKRNVRYIAVEGAKNPPGRDRGGGEGELGGACRWQLEHRQLGEEDAGQPPHEHRHQAGQQGSQAHQVPPRDRGQPEEGASSGAGQEQARRPGEHKQTPG
jgi:hypothetical protein